MKPSPFEKNVLDHAKRDEEKQDMVMDALIAWTAADHADSIQLSRNQCCLLRDGIERLRKSSHATPAMQQYADEVRKR